MRGIRMKIRHAYLRKWIIPAHAGHTEDEKIQLISARDHPRACGAYLEGDCDDTQHKGSSPRMRGIPLPFVSMCKGPGIIPAHAGHTHLQATTRRQTRDHPRACGAYAPYPERRRPRLGSSPRMRGIHRLGLGRR